RGPIEWRDVAEIKRQECSASRRYAIVASGECDHRAQTPCGYAVLDARSARPIGYVGDGFAEFVGDQLIAKTAAGYEIRSGAALDRIVRAPVRPLAVAPDGETWIVLRP